jgi:ribosome-associated protein
MRHIDWEPDWESPTIADIVKRYRGLDEETVRKAAYQYVKTRNRVHYRELFRITKAALDLEEIRKRTA